MQATPRSSKQIPKAPFCNAVMRVVFMLKLQAPTSTTNKNTSIAAHEYSLD
jgi:hypothetical protein